MRVLSSQISRVRTSQKCPLQFMSIYSNENISKIAKLSPRKFPHLVQNCENICNCLSKNTYMEWLLYSNCLSKRIHLHWMIVIFGGGGDVGGPLPGLQGCSESNLPVSQQLWYCRNLTLLSESNLLKLSSKGTRGFTSSSRNYIMKPLPKSTTVMTGSQVPLPVQCALTAFLIND